MSPSQNNVCHRRWTGGQVAAMLALGAVGLLGWFSPSSRRPRGWEAVVARALGRTHHDMLWRLAQLVAKVGSPEAVAGIAVGLAFGLYSAGRRVPALRALLAIAAGSVGAEAAKHLFARHIGLNGALGYPSGHTAGASAVAATLVITLIPTLPGGTARVLAWMAAAGTAGVVAWSRVATAVHFPADVVAGIAFGIAVPVLVLGRTQPASPASMPPDDQAAAEPPARHREPVSAHRRFGLDEETPTATPVPDRISG